MIRESIAIISFTSSIIFILIFILVCLHIKKRNYYQILEHSFNNDVISKETWLSKSFNRIFMTSGEVADYIDQYIISYTKKRNYLICHYTKPIHNITFKVLLYNAHTDLIRVYIIKEDGDLSHSSLIKLPISCQYVNIIIDSVDGMKRNSVMEKERIHKYHTLLKIETIALFCGLYPIFHLIKMMFYKDVDMEVFDMINIVGVVFIVIVCFINYKVIYKLLKKYH